jgi:hypothetical protein
MRFTDLLPAAALLLLTIACNKSEQSAAPPRDGTAGAEPATARDEMLLASVQVALPPPGINVADLPDGTSRGAAALAQYCTQCHDLPSPSMHSATDWPGVLRRMWLRMDRLPANYQLQVPDEGTRAEMISYLIAHSLQVSTNLAKGPGQQEFARICSRCHALPDPRVHSSKDWLEVFLRMERNMERMKVSPATKVETEKILSYLQNTAPAP